jgi:hypothetical protein
MMMVLLYEPHKAEHENHDEDQATGYCVEEKGIAFNNRIEAHYGQESACGDEQQACKKNKTAADKWVAQKALIPFPEVTAILVVFFTHAPNPLQDN